MTQQLLKDKEKHVFFLLEKHLISSDLISSSESPERFFSEETAGFELYLPEGYHHLGHQN